MIGRCEWPHRGTRRAIRRSSGHSAGTGLGEPRYRQTATGGSGAATATVGAELVLEVDNLDAGRDRVRAGRGPDAAAVGTSRLPRLGP
jgi:hypothetical protein